MKANSRLHQTKTLVCGVMKYPIFTLLVCAVIHRTEIGAVAELERDLIRERVAMGLKRAKKQGKRLGRPTGTKANVRQIRRLKGQGLSIRQISEKVSLSKSTVSRALQAVSSDLTNQRLHPRA